MKSVKTNKLRNIYLRILTKVGVPEESALLFADAILEADLRGVRSHGLFRFSAYVKRIQKGLINLKPSIRIIRDGASYALMNGDNGLGQVVGVKAMDLAIEKAEDTGCGIVSVFNTNHAGSLAYYSLRAVQHNMIGITMCNVSPCVAPTGGKDARIGTNPICFAIPTGKKFPIVLDMAITNASVGKIRVALDKGEKIPEGWALDKDGRPTTDPDAALKGVIQPIGGPKGYGLGLIVDILSGILSGANYGRKITHPFFDMNHTPNIGMFFLAINIESFAPFGAFIKRIDQFIDDIKTCPTIEAISEILVPGEPEFRSMQKGHKKGIPIEKSSWQQLESLACELNINLKAIVSMRELEFKPKTRD